MKTIKNLTTAKEAALYNTLVLEFQKYYTENKKHLRLAQAFVNFFDCVIYFEPNPNLFYMKDAHKARKIMENDLVTYVIGKYTK